MRNPNKLLGVVGTRPEIIKMAPVIRAASRDDRASLELVHTNQHYDDELSEMFFRNLKLEPPDFELSIRTESQGVQTADGIAGIESIINDVDPAAVIAQGDTNAVLSAAIATCKLDPKFAHVEAGIRSFDRTLPEEMNRVLADQVADLAFAPTETSREYLAAEGIEDGVYVTGNTVVDACRSHRELAAEHSDALERHGCTPGEYVIATIHRPNNTDDPSRLRAIVDALDGVDFPVLLPIHPRTRKAMEDNGIEPSGSLRIVDPLDYLDFLHVQSNARVVVTDSGGIQEEASILEVPCLTVRPNTERPETIEAGVNELVEPSQLKRRLETLYHDDRARRSMTGHPDLYGDGNAGERIVQHLLDAT